MRRRRRVSSSPVECSGGTDSSASAASIWSTKRTRYDKELEFSSLQTVVSTSFSSPFVPQIRFYPSSCKLDNSFATSSKVPYAILLINTFREYLICLCADRHVMIFAMQLQNTPACTSPDIASSIVTLYISYTEIQCVGCSSESWPKADTGSERWRFYTTSHVCHVHHSIHP